MRRFFAFLVLFVLSIPVGLSITGCQTNVGAYCNGLGYGPKTNQAATITLQPEATGLSLAWGQTGQLGSPTAAACHGASVTIAKYNYGSSNLYLADVSPTGAVCGGTWNRNSPGGIADYTICTPPAGSSGGTCTSTSCGVVQMTVAGSGVTSNPVSIYVHPPITSISISPTSAVESQCYSQNQPGPVLSPTAPPGGSPNVTVLGPNGTPIPSAYVGTITYTAVNSSIVNINNFSATGTGINGATTANMPGSTVVNATVSQSSSGSAAGYFYTCPPKSISLSIGGNSTGTIPIKAGSPQNITASILDTNGNALTGIALDYASTEPQNIAVSSLGQVSATWPGDASINAICQPTTCNIAPISQIGVFGTGTPIVSNTLKVTSPGKNSNLLWMASTQSQFFSSIDLTTGTPGSPIALPFVPNSMLMDQQGVNLYFGSYRELMVVSTASNGITKQDTSVPGVVLAVSPAGTSLIIDDQLRQVIYLYSTTSGIVSSIGGQATRAQFSPDSKNAYVVGPDALWVWNTATGWSTYTSSTTPPGPTQPTNTCNLNNNTPGSGAYDPFCGPGLALTVPSIGPFITGSPTTAWGFCPNVTVTTPGTPTIVHAFYPQAASVGIQTDQVAATEDGLHIIGADSKDNELSDIGVTVPTGACPASNTGITLTPTFTQTALGVTPSEIDQVVASPTSTVAFVTYQSPSATGILPAYTPSTTPGGAGTITNVQLSGGAKAPVAGIFAPNTTIFFVSTSGDNLVHFVDPNTLTDTQTINPALVDPSGTPVPVQMMAVKPRSTL
jgi:trimeric autotransporter adhesin